MLFRVLRRFVKYSLYLSLALSYSYAVAVQKKPKIVEKPKPVEQPNLEEKLIKQNIEISEWFDGVAESIDLFFIGKKVTRDKNETRVTIENTTYSMEHTDLKNNTSIGVYPRFPNLEKYWALKFTTYDEKEARQNVQNNYIRKSSVRRKNYGATVAWFRKFGDVRTSFEPRIELQDPLRISHSLSFDSTANFENHNFKPKLELYASARRGPGIFQAYDFNYFISKKWTLTFINQADYLDETRIFNVSNGFIFGHEVSKKTSLSYGFIVNSNNRPNYHLDGYVASVSFNEQVYKKIFDYTITPYLEFQKSNSFKGEVGGVLNLRLTF